MVATLSNGLKEQHAIEDNPRTLGVISEAFV